MKLKAFLKEQEEQLFNDLGGLVCDLLLFEKQVHLWHLQTDDFNEHKILQGFYEGITALTDKLAESVTSMNGKIMVDENNERFFRNYEYNAVVEDFTTYSETVNEYFTLTSNIASVNSALAGIAELLDSTIYKLTELS